MTTRLIIVQPYVPAYRVAFFEGLIENLAKKDVDCIVAAGVPKGDQAERGDAVARDWQAPIDIKTIPLGRRTIDVALSPAPWRGADAIIMDIKGSSLPVYQAMLQSHFKDLRLGLWGHVRPYVNAGHWVDLRMEKYQMQYANHVFAYTTGGARYAIENGVDANKVTALMNTVDTLSLERCVHALTFDEVRAFAAKYEFNPDRTVCFIGGLDSSKRVDFLAMALDSLWQRDRTVKVLVGGQGVDEHFLRTAYGRGQAVALGYADDRLKSLILKSSRAVCMPGRIGLVAVDSLVAHRTVITTEWPFHAPEAEYLKEGLTKLTTTNNPSAYADGILEILDGERNTRSVHMGRQYPTLPEMIERFSQGVSKMLAN